MPHVKSRVHELVKMTRWSNPFNAPTSLIAIIFLIQKASLLLLAGLSPGAGYDTSTQLLLDDGKGGHPNWLVTKLSRWDAIYFGTVASRGYLWEQEWAFGWGFTGLISLIANGELSATQSSFTAALTKEAFRSLYPFTNSKLTAPHTELVAAIAVAHLAHLASAIVLYHLTIVVFGGFSGKKLALISAILHVFSPAGLFLSAPYAESLFSFLAFSGCLLYAKSIRLEAARALEKDFAIIASGLLFGLATLMRSNGVLNGLIFLHAVSSELPGLLTLELDISKFRRVMALVLAGLTNALGMLIPQWIAYNIYCKDMGRPWCAKRLPSIYEWVQDHYWNVGLFRYWTLSNAPLFLLSAPMLLILTSSGLHAIRGKLNVGSGRTTDIAEPKSSAFLNANTPTEQDGQTKFVQSLASTQLFLAALAITTYHVQIITRISSGYVVWRMEISSDSPMDDCVSDDAWDFIGGYLGNLRAVPSPAPNLSRFNVPWTLATLDLQTAKSLIFESKSSLSVAAKITQQAFFRKWSGYPPELGSSHESSRMFRVLTC
ncbi:MAG: ER membrane glycoprotein subunit of the GPI transamidase complex-like protein [Trizodia sp. TS-e1964]|nr:MAG: ER membrane glycoprotein subunit of the GPI transamidase complex-like protein [Trizodia sp. TS-e1964]